MLSDNVHMHSVRLTAYMQLRLGKVLRTVGVLGLLELELIL